ncbi:MAG: hypothetical protein QOJ29_5172 [Thermoleophilaceae bacterium]|jgi:hypothetical protein|nr:hypothetical protein [Thermoleophilaceae bacterium]
MSYMKVSGTVAVVVTALAGGTVPAAATATRADTDAGGSLPFTGLGLMVVLLAAAAAPPLVVRLRLTGQSTCGGGELTDARRGRPAQLE